MAISDAMWRGISKCLRCARIDDFATRRSEPVVAMYWHLCSPSRSLRTLGKGRTTSVSGTPAGSAGVAPAMGQEETLAQVRHAKPSFPRKPNRDTLSQAHTGAVWGSSGNLVAVTHCKAKGVHHARPLLGLDGSCLHSRRCQRRHFVARHPDLGSGSLPSPACGGG